MNVTIKQPEIVFRKATLDKSPSLIYSLDGLPKTGKTHFYLTMPKPLVIFDFNRGLKGVIDEYVERDEEVYVEDYTIPYSVSLSNIASSLDKAPEAWKSFTTKFVASLNFAQSIAVDLASEAWDLARLARLGRLAQVPPVKYAEVNAEFRQLIQMALGSGKNVVFAHKLKPEYKNDVKTANFERSGFADIGFDVEAVLRTTRDLSQKGLDQFAVQVEECRANYKASGIRFIGEKVTFDNVFKAIYGG